MSNHNQQFEYAPSDMLYDSARGIGHDPHAYTAYDSADYTAYDSAG